MSAIYVSEVLERLLAPEVMDDSKETMFSKHKDNVHMNSDILLNLHNNCTNSRKTLSQN